MEPSLDFNGEPILTFCGVGEANLLERVKYALSEKHRKTFEEEVPNSFFDRNFAHIETSVTLTGESAKLCIKGLCKLGKLNLEDLTNPSIASPCNVKQVEEVMALLVQISSLQQENLFANNPLSELELSESLSVS